MEISTQDQPEIFVIIGGCGFLGQHLLHLLLVHYQNKNTLIRLIDRVDNLKKIKLIYPEEFSDKRVMVFLNVDISQDNLESLFKNAKIIFHLAAVIAYGKKNKNFLYKNNFEGVKNVFKFAELSYIKKIIFVSSFATLGCLNNKDKRILADETCKNNWEKETDSYYSLSKWYAEEFLNSVSQKIKIAIVIPGILLGPGPCHHASILPFQIAFERNFMFVPEGGSSYVDVRDMALGLILLTENLNATGQYLFVSHVLKHDEFLESIAPLAKRKVKFIKIPKVFGSIVSFFYFLLEWFLPKDSHYSKEGVIKTFKYRFYSARKAREELGWRPKYKLEETLQDAITWLRDNKKL